MSNSNFFSTKKLNTAEYYLNGTKIYLENLSTGLGAVGTVFTSAGPNKSPIWEAPAEEGGSFEHENGPPSIIQNQLDVEIFKVRGLADTSGNEAQRPLTVTMGWGCTGQTGGFAIGKDAAANGEYSVAMGEGCTAGGDYSLTMGQHNIAQGNYSVAIGLDNNKDLSGDFDNAYSVAMGENNQIRGNGSIGLGTNNLIGTHINISTEPKNSIAAGNNNWINSDYSVAMGFENNEPYNTTGWCSVAMGYKNRVAGAGSVAMGNQNNVGATGSVAIGKSCEIIGYNSVAIGENCIITHTNNASDVGCFAFGKNITLGNNIPATNNSNETFAFGYEIDIQNSNQGYCFGKELTANSIAASDYCLIGKQLQASSTGNEIRIGGYAHQYLQGTWMVDGNLDVTGTVTENSTGSGSDDRIKHNEKEITNAINIILQLKPLKYFKTQKLYDANHDFILDSSGLPMDNSGNPITDYTIESGFIAQDLLKIDELNYTVTGGDQIDSSGNTIERAYAVKYNDIHAFHVKATQELYERLKKVETENAYLKEENLLQKTRLTSLETRLDAMN